MRKERASSSTAVAAQHSTAGTNQREQKGTAATAAGEEKEQGQADRTGQDVAENYLFGGGAVHGSGTRGGLLSVGSG